MRDSYDDADRVRMVQANVPGGDGPMRFSPIRTGKFNTSYYATAAGGEYVIRIAPPDDAVYCHHHASNSRA